MSDHDRAQSVTPQAEQQPCASDASNRARELALDRAKRGELLDWRDLSAILRVGRSQFFKRDQRGAYDAFKVRPIVGPKHFSGTLIWRWVQGEPVFVPTFGRTQRRA